MFVNVDDGSTASNNGNGGAINIRDVLLVTVNDTTFVNCSADESGGSLYLGSGVYLGSDTPTVNAMLHNVTVLDSVAVGGNGGALLWEPTATYTLVVSSCSLVGSAPSSSGGGLAIHASPDAYVWSPDASSGRLLAVNGSVTPPTLVFLDKSFQSTFAGSSALYGAILATSPRKIALSSDAGCASMSACPSSGTYNISTLRSLSMIVLDELDTLCVGDYVGTCSAVVNDSSISVSGDSALVVDGSVSFPSLSVQGVLGSTYAVTISCSFGAAFTVALAPQLLLTVPLCSPGWGPLPNQLSCQQCQPGRISADGMECVACECECCRDSQYWSRWVNPGLID